MNPFPVKTKFTSASRDEMLLELSDAGTRSALNPLYKSTIYPAALFSKTPLTLHCFVSRQALFISPFIIVATI